MLPTKTKTILWVLLLLPLLELAAQPVNDECINATPISNVDNFCSGPFSINITDATESPEPVASCFPLGSAANDVWFSFTAAATDVNIVMIGANNGEVGPSGTLIAPQFALYQGDCGTLTEVQCASDNAFPPTNITETFAGPLTVGATYFIRCAARDGNVGSFELCVNNFNQVPEPDGDCDSGVVLCDKSPFTVESVVGNGDDPNEVSGSNCLFGENATTWYKWTCDQPGTLEFTLTPNNPADDLDFAIYELPNGIDNCNGKIELGCMASGENVSDPFATWQPCTGPTGMFVGDGDFSEAAGCQPGDNNFIEAINMVSGVSYALIIDNFSNTGNGFAIEWGGTGTFLGPDADFLTDAPLVCVGSEINFTDNSTSVSGIAEWEWNFGVGATPATAIGPGPHSVTYSNVGTKSITLRITSEAGCIITDIQNISVEPSPQADVMVGADYCDPTIPSGFIVLSPTEGVPPFQYDLDNSGVFTSDSSFTDLNIGTFTVTILDGLGCTTDIEVEIPEGLALDPTVDPVVPVTCFGDADGEISISVDIGNDPITYDFGNGPQTDNSITGLVAGIYTVTVVDGIGCTGEFVIEVPQNPPVETTLDSIDISCNGEDDGVIITNTTGGTELYFYLWNTGSEKDDIEDLAPGDYSVTITDSNGCTTVAETSISEPPVLELRIVDLVDVVCFGDTTGIIELEAVGGVPDYQYSIDGSNFQDTALIVNLAAGDYSVTVLDANGCETVIDTFIGSPPPLIVDAGTDTTINLGFSAPLDANHVPPFRPVAYTWVPAATLDCDDCDDPLSTPIITTTYFVSIVDSTQCRSIDSVTVNVILDYPIYAPNVFSPNNDDINDRFILFGNPAARIIRDLKIFNRWGGLVYQGANLTLGDTSNGWDGTFGGEALNPDVFVWLAEVEFIDGNVFTVSGDVLILK